MNLYAATTSLAAHEEIRVDDAYSGDRYRLHLGPLTVFLDPTQAEQLRQAIGMRQLERSET